MIHENTRQLSSREGDLCVAENVFQPLISTHEKEAMSDHKRNTRKEMQVKLEDQCSSKHFLNLKGKTKNAQLLVWQ
jgi:hypothetical protein